ncbi:hypothetical protein SCUP234_13299 [Seiridium cupressi]
MNLLKPMLSGALLASLAALAAREDKPDFAVSPIDADNDRKDIFNKYFNEDDRLLVRQVFKKIMGDPESPRDLDATGSNALGDISIKEDSPNGDDLYCDGDYVIAQLRNYDVERSTLIMCPGSFGHGGIGLGYDSFKEINCEYIGSILLHEYT